jgi:acylphosphatase
METTETKDRVRIVVTGRVQGVGFRWTVKTAADAAGVVGTARNLADGTVEVYAEAEQETLTAFVGSVFRGSPAGRVDDMLVVWAAGEDEWTDFRIVP